MEMINIELLGYQLIKINKDTYDATALAKHEELGDILTACAEKQLDIISYNNGRLILKKY